MERIPVTRQSELQRLEAAATLGWQLAEKLVGVRAEIEAAQQSFATHRGESTGLGTLGDNPRA